MKMHCSLLAEEAIKSAIAIITEGRASIPRRSSAAMRTAPIAAKSRRPGFYPDLCGARRVSPAGRFFNLR